MKKNLDELFDVYTEFGECVGVGSEHWSDKTWLDDTGLEHALLVSDTGFHLELTNERDAENAACMQCWYTNGCPAIVTTLEEALKEYCSN